MLSNDEQILEAVIGRFEDNWHPDLSGELNRWIEENANELRPQKRAELLVELIKIDLEFCWRVASIPATLERYCNILPEVSFELAREEYLVRHRWGDLPDLSEYEERFGEIGRRMSVELQDTKPLGTTPAGSATMPDQVGRFRILRTIGKGSFGCVYLAQDPVLHRYVALKIAARNPQFDEAATSASITHPAFVRVFDVLPVENSICIVMEYVNGCTFADWLASPQFSLQESLEILAEVAEALSAAHANGLIHCDVKAANILIDADDRPRITDFGLAIRQEFQRATFGNDICGSPAYMSPEQVRGELKWLDGRTDIWAIGVLIYRAMTGQHPFSAKTIDQTFDQILYDEPTWPSTADPNLSPELVEICLRCLRKRISERWETGDQLADAIRQVVKRVPSDGERNEQPTEHTPTDLDPSLPADHTTIGREDEITSCLKVLSGETKLLTLHGPGGIGKTTLAATIARRAKDFDSVLFLDLSSLRDGNSLQTAMYTKLGIDCNDATDLSLITAVRCKGKSLIVLDNFEQLVPEGIGVVKNWLGQFATCRLLVTSRVRLGIPQEQVVKVGPLDLKSAEDELSQGAQLFVSVASRVDPEFELPKETETISRICKRLDGIPLGIELAASRIAILEPDQILAELESNKSVGSSESSDPRHRTLADAIQWSIDLLGEDDLRSLKCLATLPSGCLVRDAQSLLKPIVKHPLDRIQRLRDHSLLQTVRTQFGKRIVLYQSVRDVLATADCAELASWVTKTFVTLCDERLRSLDNQPDLAISEQLLAERENLAAILVASLQSIDLEVACRAFACLGPPLRLHGMYNELANFSNKLQSANLAAAPEELVVQVNLLIARNELDLGRSDNAEQILTAALETAEECRALSLASEAQLLLAELHTTRGNLTQAEMLCADLYGEAALTDRQKFDVNLLLAQIRRRSGKFDSALGLLNEAQRIAQRHANDVMLAAVTRRKGNLEVSRGNLQLAVEVLEGSEQIARRSTNPRGEHLALTSRAVAFCELGEFRQAIECFDAAQTIATRLGEVRAIAINEGNRGIALSGLGDFVGAIDCYTRAESLNGQLNRKTALALNQSNRAVVVAAMGDFEEAVPLCRSGYELVCSSGDELNAAIVRIDLGIILRSSGAYADASAELSAAFGQVERSYLPAGSLVTGQIALCESLLKIGRDGEAERVAKSIKFDESVPSQHVLMGNLRDRIESLKKK